MTCKDCVHYDVCEALENGNGIKKVHPIQCGCFKNKADYVEVVRCCKCKNLTVHNSPTLYAYCEKTHFRFEPFQTDTRTHFCGFGERRDTE